MRNKKRSYRRRPKVTGSEALIYKSPSTSVTGDNATDLNGWKYVGHFGAYFILGKGNKRRIVDPKTGRHFLEYTKSNTGIRRSEHREESPQAGESDKDDRL